MRPRAAAFIVTLLVGSLSFSLQATPAAACGNRYTPAGGGTFAVGQFTNSESYRGLEGTISIAASTPDPDPTESHRYHIAAAISSNQSDSTRGEIWSEIGWQMGILTRPQSGTEVYTHAPNVFFEGIDNVGDYRDVYGAASSSGQYQVVEAGRSSNNKWKYNAWFYRSGSWYLGGYAELERQYTFAEAKGEATDTTNYGDTCLTLAPSGSYHELGSPTSLQMLTTSWNAWSSSISTGFALDNGNPYKYQGISNYYDIKVWGP